MPLVVRHRVIERALSRQSVVDGPGKQIGVAQCVADAERQIRIFVATGIADKRPARTKRSAQEVWQVGGAVESFLASSAANALTEPGNEIDNGHERSFEVRLNGSLPPNRPPDKEGKQAIVRWMPKDGPFAPFVKLQAIGGHTAPVGEIPAGDRRRHFGFCCPDGSGEGGAAAVRPPRGGGGRRF